MNAKILLFRKTRGGTFKSQSYFSRRKKTRIISLEENACLLFFGKTKHFLDYQYTYKLPIKDCICPYVSENIVLRVRCGLRHNPAQTDGCASANISAVLYHTQTHDLG